LTIILNKDAQTNITGGNKKSPPVMGGFLIAK